MNISIIPIRTSATVASDSAGTASRNPEMVLTSSKARRQAKTAVIQLLVTGIGWQHAYQIGSRLESGGFKNRRRNKLRGAAEIQPEFAQGFAAKDNASHICEPDLLTGPLEKISPARDAAFRVLKKVHGGGYASDLLRREKLDARDASLAESIVLGSLRYRSQLDFLIGHFSGRPQPGLDEEVRIALRIAIFQLRYLDRIPAHAAVTESVELVKRAHKRSAAPFVNAVLRKVNRKPVKWPSLAVELSVPEWMLARWEKKLGPEIAHKICLSALQAPAAHINPQTGRRQDIGAQSVVPLLAIESGMTALDLCAAPGNKTAQVLAAGAAVVATDRFLKRLSDVPAEARRVVVDATQPLPFKAKFDRILIDAPCSGTGTLSANPEIKWRLKPDDFPQFQSLQRRILQNGLELLKPGGRLVYSTCSLETEENEEVTAGFPVVETHLRIPARDPGDGFYAAVIA